MLDETFAPVCRAFSKRSLEFVVVSVVLLAQDLRVASLFDIH